MIISNTKNREIKEVQMNDSVLINGDEYKVVGQTEKSWRFLHIGRNPRAKKNETWNKNTFANRFFFNGKNWGFVRTTKTPNFDYV